MTTVYCQTKGCKYIRKNGVCGKKIIDLDDDSDSRDAVEKMRCKSARGDDDHEWFDGGVQKDGS